MASTRPRYAGLPLCKASRLPDKTRHCENKEKEDKFVRAEHHVCGVLLQQDSSKAPAQQRSTKVSKAVALTGTGTLPMGYRHADGQFSVAAHLCLPVAAQGDQHPVVKHQQATPAMFVKKGTQYMSPTPEQLPPAARPRVSDCNRGLQQQLLVQPQTPQQQHSRWRRLSGQQTATAPSGRLPAYMKRMLMVHRPQQFEDPFHQPQQLDAQQSALLHLQQQERSSLPLRRKAEEQPDAYQQEHLRRRITVAGCHHYHMGVQLAVSDSAPALDGIVQGLECPAQVNQHSGLSVAQTPQNTPADQPIIEDAVETDVVKETPLSGPLSAITTATATAAVSADQLARGVVAETPVSPLADAAIMSVVEATPTTAGLHQVTTAASGRTASTAATIQADEAATVTGWGAAPPNRAPSVSRKPAVRAKEAAERAEVCVGDNTGHGARLSMCSSAAAHSSTTPNPQYIKAVNTAAMKPALGPLCADLAVLSKVSHAKREQWWALWQQQQQPAAARRADPQSMTQAMDAEAADPTFDDDMHTLSTANATCTSWLAADCSVLLDVTQISNGVSRAATSMLQSPAALGVQQRQDAAGVPSAVMAPSEIPADDQQASTSRELPALHEPSGVSAQRASQPAIPQVAQQSDLAQPACEDCPQAAADHALQPQQGCDLEALQLPAAVIAETPGPRAALEGTATDVRCSAGVTQSASMETPTARMHVEQTQSDVCATLGTLAPLTLGAYVSQTPLATLDVNMQDVTAAATAAIHDDQLHVQGETAAVESRLQAAIQAAGDAVITLHHALPEDCTAIETCAVHGTQTAVEAGSAGIAAPAEAAEAVKGLALPSSPAVATYGSDHVATCRSLDIPASNMTPNTEQTVSMQHNTPPGPLTLVASPVAVAPTEALQAEAAANVAERVSVAQPVSCTAGESPLAGAAAVTGITDMIVSLEGQATAAGIVPSSSSCQIDPVLGIDLEAAFLLAEQFDREIHELHGDQMQYCSHWKGDTAEQQLLTAGQEQLQEAAFIPQDQQQRQGQSPQVQQFCHQGQQQQHTPQPLQQQQNLQHPDVCSLDWEMLEGLTQQLHQDTNTAAAATAESLADDTGAAADRPNSAGRYPYLDAAAFDDSIPDTAITDQTPDPVTFTPKASLCVEPPGLLSCAGVTQVTAANGTPQTSQTQSCLQLSPEVADLAFHDPPNHGRTCPMICESFPFQKDAVAFAAWCNQAGPAAVALLQQQQRGRNFGSFHERQQFLQRYMQQHRQQQQQQEVQGGVDAGVVLGGGSETTREAVAAAAAAVASSERLLQGPARQSAQQATAAAAQAGAGSSSAVEFPWVRVFTEEYAGRNGYTRRFLAASYQALWCRHLQTPPPRRHLYEVIQDGYPCHLYFDIEYNRAANPHVNGDYLVNKLLGMVRDMLLRMDLPTDVTLTKGCVLELDSSTAEKFSRHIVVRVPGHAFRDNQQIGAFVRSLVSNQEADFLYLAKTAGDSGERACMVDTAVYTKNRHFRMLGSSKGGKQALLQPTSNRWAMSAAQNNERHLLPQQLFLMSLICNVHPDSILLDYLPPVPAAFQQQQQQQRASGGPQQLRSSSVVGGSEVLYQYPDRPDGGPIVVGTEAPVGQVRSYRSIKATWGPLHQPGQVQQQAVVQAEGPSQELMDPVVLQDIVLQSVWFVEDVATRRAHGAAAQVRTVAYCGRSSACSRHCAFAFSLIGPGSHMCANVGRNHRNNHVFYVVDFAAGVYCQKCHDPDCWGFRSPWLPLPQEVWQRERLMGQQQQEQQGQ